MTLTSDEVRAVVRDEQIHTEKTLDRMADSMEQLVEFMVESKANEKANEQKFIRVHERIEGNEHRINEQGQSLLTLTTHEIPSIQQEVAKNTLSASVFWRFFFMLIMPLCSGLGGIFYLFNKSQEAQMQAIIDAIKLIAKSMGG